MMAQNGVKLQVQNCDLRGSLGTKSEQLTIKKEEVGSKRCPYKLAIIGCGPAGSFRNMCKLNNNMRCRVFSYCSSDKNKRS